MSAHHLRHIPQGFVGCFSKDLCEIFDIGAFYRFHAVADFVAQLQEILVDREFAKRLAIGGEDIVGRSRRYAKAKDEAPRIVAELGKKRTMIMRNHGLLAVGRTLGEMFYFMGKLIKACELQERVMATGGAINPIPPEVIAVANKQSVERYANKPYGNLDWKMLTRRLARVDSSFMA